MIARLIFITAFFFTWCGNVSADSDAKKSFKKPPKAVELYVTVRPDFRKCISPICGGWYVNPVNRRVMKCPDGSVRKECYVGTDEINIKHLTDEQINELRQAMYDSRVLIYGNISNAIDYGLFSINKAWISANSQPPSGKFVNVSDNGIRCITYPCLSYDGQILNRHLIKSLAGVDLSGVDAKPDQIDMAYNAIASDEGLPISGKFVEVSGPAGTAQGIEATQFYFAVTGNAPKMCMTTGCLGQICSDTDVITTCEWRPEYACYQNASCSNQVDGECGWEMTEELMNCLASTKLSQTLGISN